MVKIGFIGMGNMGNAILNGLLKTHRPEDMIFSAAHQDKMEAVTARTKVPHAGSNRECAKAVKYLILAVKPQYFDAVFSEIRDVVTPEQVVISLAPGVTISNITERLGGNVRVVRAMPNTPAMVGEGMTALCDDSNFSKEDFDFAKGIFDAVGRTIVLPERLFDGVIAISGSSPAYVFMMIEAMADAGVKEGLPRSCAYEMAAQAVLGSALMVLQSGTHPASLKDAVCSPGGTTIEAVEELERKGFRAAIMDALRACAEKSRDMSR